jgi:hypothetical protein
MITFENVRDRYIIEAEKNATNDNITTDNLRFCNLFNQSQNKYLTLHLQQRGVDDIRYVQKFLVLDYSIKQPTKAFDKTDFKLPENFFDYSDARAKAKKDNCEGIISLFEINTENLNEIITDEFHQPSFEWREAPCTVNSDKLSIYTGDFEISEILLNYYRYPNQIKLVDENNPESNFDQTLPIEWDNKALDAIISLMVFNNDITENNPRYQAQMAKIQK